MRVDLPCKEERSQGAESQFHTFFFFFNYLKKKLDGLRMEELGKDKLTRALVVTEAETFGARRSDKQSSI